MGPDGVSKWGSRVWTRSTIRVGFWRRRKATGQTWQGAGAIRRCREYNSDAAQWTKSVPWKRGGRSSSLTTGIESKSEASNLAGAVRSSIR